MEVSAKDVMALRQKTGCGMMAIKKALEEVDGDQEKAIELLRKRGETKSAEKASRKAGEGVVAIKMEGQKGVVASVFCETDFVARNEDFVKLAQTIADRYFEKGETAQSENEQAVKEAVGSLGENIKLGEWKLIEASTLGSYVHSNRKIGVIIGLEGGKEEQAKDVAMHAAAMNPVVVSPEEVTDEIVSKEKEIWTEQLKQEGRPENIMENILKGKEKKFREEGALVSQAFVKDPSQTIQGYLGDAKVAQYIRVAI